MPASTRKSLARPLSAPSTPHSHWAPQTPHGTRALQLQLQRSGGANARTNNRRKSARVQKPWSAKRTLRALSRAALNEPSKLKTLVKNQTPDSPKKRLSSSIEKENELQDPSTDGLEGSDDDEEEERALRAKRPRLSLPIDDVQKDDEQGSPLPEAPTPSMLHEEEDYDNLTLKSIEYGRRAVSEGPLSRRFSRPSFGSIRMSDFTAADLKDYGISPDVGRKRLFKENETNDDDNIMAMGDDDELDAEALDDTPDIRNGRQSLGFPDVNETTLELPPADQEDHDTFRLDFNIPEQSPLAADANLNATQRDSPLFVSPSPSHSATAKARQSRPSPVVSPRSPFIPRPSSPSPPPSPRSPVQTTPKPSKPSKRKQKLSRHNLKVPALPSSLQKRLATSALNTIGRQKSRIGKDSLRAIEQATEWFFEQVGEDLEAYSDHAGRKKRVVEEDASALMRRQERNIGMGDDGVGGWEGLAKEYLPRDVRGEVEGAGWLD
ncbi:MAG: hypothetical protein Q9160_001466 [Pyrenula sp. 1 TL-2023]